MDQQPSPRLLSAATEGTTGHSVPLPQIPHNVPKQGLPFRACKTPRSVLWMSTVKPPSRHLSIWESYKDRRLYGAFPQSPKNTHLRHHGQLPDPPLLLTSKAQPPTGPAQRPPFPASRPYISLHLSQTHIFFPSSDSVLLNRLI